MTQRVIGVSRFVAHRAGSGELDVCGRHRRFSVREMAEAVIVSASDRRARSGVSPRWGRA